MNEDVAKDGDFVSVSMELTGKYEDVIGKLQPSGSRRAGIEPFVHDLDVLLETIIEMDGGTRSAIAKQLPAEMTRSYDAQAVVDTLQVLERYDLVVLEGNTWKPGSTIDE